jgi:hypothetical protein
MPTLIRYVRLVSRVMKNLLIDRARHKKAAAHGGAMQRIEWNESAVASHDGELTLAVAAAMDDLATRSPRLAELVELRYFGGFTETEVRLFETLKSAGAPGSHAMPDRCDLGDDVLEEALDLPAADREAFVAARCGSDEALLAEVLRLLALSNTMDGFPNAPPVPLAEIRPADVLGGRFRIAEELGAGGTGSIFLVEDRRLGKVALKTLNLELRTTPARWSASLRKSEARAPYATPMYVPCSISSRSTMRAAGGSPLLRCNTCPGNRWLAGFHAAPSLLAKRCGSRAASAPAWMPCTPKEFRIAT